MYIVIFTILKIIIRSNNPLEKKKCNEPSADSNVNLINRNFMRNLFLKFYAFLFNCLLHFFTSSPNFLDLLFWSGYIRLDPCSAVMFNSTCGTDVDPSIPLFEFDVKEKQCAAISHRDVSQSDWRFCSERHPFICEKQLGIY